MSHKLPDDIQQWPTDPYALLGIAVDAVEKSIKRAYFGILKTIDVDNEPAKFQLVQEAYEAAKSGNRRVVGEHTASAAETETTQENLITQQDLSSFTPVQRFGKDLATASSDKPIEEIWSLLKNGSTLAAEELIERQGCLQDTGVGLALYAIQRVHAHRDDLVEAGKRVSLLLKLVGEYQSHDDALYYMRHEFLAHAKLAELPVIDDYLAIAKNFEHKFEIASLRWQALGVNNPTMVAKDLEQLSRHEFDFGERWPSIVALAMEYILWTKDPALESHKQRCEQWLAEDFSNFSDRVETIKFAAEELSGNPMLWNYPLSLLVRLAATGFDENHLAVWESLAEDISNSYRNGLRILDSLFRKYPYSMSMVLHGLDRFSRHQAKTGRRTKNEQDVLASQMGCVLIKFASSWYPDTRETLLKLSVQNYASLSFFGSLLDRFLPEDHLRTWSAEIKNDQALQCAVIAGFMSY